MKLINRRVFLGLCLQASVASVVPLKALGQSTQFYTPPADLAGNWTFTPDPKLPNVLLIGDSISIGYTRDVRRMLQGVANVYRPMKSNEKPDNCANTQVGLEHVHQWLGQTKWDIIHFNWGLWDLCYRNHPSTVDGHQQVVNRQDVPIQQYRINLEKLVDILEQTHARLIWASTSKVPPASHGRIQGDDVEYNKVAAKIMHHHRIPIDDVYALTKTLPADLSRKPGNVHYKPEGYKRIAEQVAASIRSQLHG